MIIVGCTRQRQRCDNNDWPRQWEMAIFDPPQNPHPLTDRQKLVQVIASTAPMAVPNLVQIRPWGLLGKWEK